MLLFREWLVGQKSPPKLTEADMNQKRHCKLNSSRGKSWPQEARADSKCLTCWEAAQQGPTVSRSLALDSKTHHVLLKPSLTMWGNLICKMTYVGCQVKKASRSLELLTQVFSKHHLLDVLPSLVTFNPCDYWICELWLVWNEIGTRCINLVLLPK